MESLRLMAYTLDLVLSNMDLALDHKGNYTKINHLCCCWIYCNVCWWVIDWIYIWINQLNGCYWSDSLWNCNFWVWNWYFNGIIWIWIRTKGRTWISIMKVRIISLITIIRVLWVGKLGICLWMLWVNNWLCYRCTCPCLWLSLWLRLYMLHLPLLMGNQMGNRCKGLWASFF